MWRQKIGNVVDVAVESDEVDRFAGHVATIATARVVLSRIASSSVHLLRTPDTINSSRIDHLGIMLVTNGSMAVTGGLECVVGIGDVLVFDLLRAFGLQMSLNGGLSECITFWIPRPRLISVVSNEFALHGIVLRGTSPSGQLVGTSMQSLMTEVHRMSAAELDTLCDAVIELAARTLAPAVELAALSGTAQPLAAFATIRRYVDKHLMTTTLNANMIAKTFGLSRASLFRLFEPVGGVASYIRRARLQRAFQQITASEVSGSRIGQIAYGLGFKNVPTFNRLFREAYGCSPGQARRKFAQSKPNVLLKASHNEDSLTACLKRLGQL